ncbi:sulfite oxidase-like oxidoreductase [Paenibacillus kyungheensis]|uniref:Sulfite oxidase-like oxidoreductase n=1 Tax=Paenibacillus kyungheensis TaxID=1452732 RepID=A0AAX3M3V5_9BACL|nr:sulfite oxidase-like oxidoreductase [Paenibacillus kyungheensis]WCT56899.1 sulfite oxidase-like oxidoreductase [Paenibacillus kyungheensis]
MKNKAERIKNAKVPLSKNLGVDQADRLPPGQFLTETFPILHEGDVPDVDTDTWQLKIFGEVEQEQTFSYTDLLNLPKVQMTSDIHCVTRWSKFDTLWEGVRFRDLLDVLQVKPEAQYVMVHGGNDYETNVPLADLLSDNVLLAYHYDHKPLTPKHGYPVRLVVPHLYFWKSAKWITGLEFMKEDRPGFWEQNGFHNEADPFAEQRFSGEALPIPEDEWTKKEFD